MCPQATNFFLFPPAGTSRQYNDGDMIQCGPVSNSAQDFDPIVFRQMQIQQDHLWIGVRLSVLLVVNEFEQGAGRPLSAFDSARGVALVCLPA